MSNKLTSGQRGRLESLLTAFGPSGYEAPAARTWRAMAEEFADEVSADAAGNSLAVVHGTDPHAPTILLTGHIDEIGLLITFINSDGFLYFKEIGGWDPTVFPGQRVMIMTEKGPVPGVIGRRATHLMSYEEQDEPIRTKDLWIDIGAKSKKQAEEMVRVGDAAVMDVKPIHFPNRRIVSRALDNRVGAFVVLEALRAYAEKPGVARVVAAANTQEEIAMLGGGALSATRRVQPDVAIVVDMTFASDHPDLDDEIIAECGLGTGPVLARGSIISPVVFAGLEATAKKLKMKYTIDGVPGLTGTDADAVAVGADHAVATGLVSVPSRYMHTPNEMISLDDVASLVRLLAEYCRTIKPGMNLIP